MKRTILFVCVLSALLAFWTTPVVAQVLYGSVTGTVQDPSGAVVPKAHVTLTNIGTGLTREADADDGGRYSITSVLPGTYSLKIASPGFRTTTRGAVEIKIGFVTREDMKLEVGQTSEQVTVSAAAVSLQTDKSDIRTEVTGEVIQNLPLPAYRNYQSLMALVPGATPPAFQNAVVDTPGRALRSFVNGTATNNNNTLTDGAVNINIWLPHHVAYVQPVESIETVNITTGSFNADQGMAGGAAVTVTTKSGTNTLHGTGIWFHTDQHLQSVNTYFRGSTFVKPLNILNIGGGNIGGPIKKDKLFYFFNFERTTERTGYAGNYSVAPADFRAGDFSKWTQYYTIFDPASAAQNNSIARVPFGNNMVPQGRVNPIFSNIYKGMPLPNQISPTDPLNLSGNYFTSGVLSLNRNQYDLKLNYNPTKNLIIWGKYSRMDAPVQGKYPFGDLGGSPLGTAGKGETTTQLATVGYTYTFSPTFLMDGVFGYTRFDQFVGIPNVDKNVGLDVWKIPGTNGGAQYAKDNRYGGAPAVTGFGFSDIGFLETWTPVWRHERAYSYQTNFSKLHRAHEFRFGLEVRRLELNHWQPETANPRGSINFGAGSTYSPNESQKRGSGNSFAAALMGLVSSYSKSIQYFEMKTRELQYAAYVQDRWQVSRRLTVNLGLRYEYYPLLNRGDRGLERWDPATNIVYFGGLGNTPRNAGIEVSKRLFAPRIGIAYRTAENWVLRAAYGLTYDPLGFGRPLRGQYPATLTGSWIPSVSTYGWYNSVDQGIPDIAIPDVSKGQAVLPTNVDMGPRSPYGGMLHRGYIQSWNATIERRLPGNSVGSVAYVGTRTIHQLIDININTIGPGLGTTTANLPLAKAHGRTIGANMWDGWGTAFYNALQASFNKGFGHGLFMKTAYTWSKSLSNADEDGWVGLPLWNWGPMIRRNYSPSGYDRRHMFTTGFNYGIPVGKGERFVLTNKVADMALGGWKLVGSFVAYTGTPFNVTGSASSLQCIGCTQTANQIGAVKKLGGFGPQNPYYDPMSFRDPLFTFNPANPNYIPGTMGRNVLYGPGYWRLNPGIYKGFKIKEKYNMEFRAESNNITNSPIWSNPNGGSASLRLTPQGALDTSVANPTGNFMSITGASTGREFRFGLRVAF
ncbi:MAG: TonB-dependent receptor [Candidatus Solibacter usitatus]|nr:TonB-dependent receptor [Candidatus Solibacter usitatus]